MLSVFRLQSICNAYQKLQRNFFLPFPCYGSIFCGLKNGLEIVQMRLHVGFWLNLFFIFVFFSQWMCISCRNALLLGIIRITCIYMVTTWRLKYPFQLFHWHSSSPTSSLLLFFFFFCSMDFSHMLFSLNFKIILILFEK